MDAQPQQRQEVKDLKQQAQNQYDGNSIDDSLEGYRVSQNQTGQFGSQLEKIAQSLTDTIKLLKDSSKIEKHLKVAKVSKEELIESLGEIQTQFLSVKTIAEKQKTNVNMLTEAVSFIASLFSNIKLNQMESIDQAIWILEFQSKISCTMHLFRKSLYLEDDIITLPSQHYQHVWKKITLQTLGDDKKVKEKFSKLKRILTVTASAVISEQSKDWDITKLVTFGLAYPKYLIMDKTCQLKAMRFNRKPEVQMAKKIWNLPENGMLREMAKIKLKNIVTNKKIYIPLDPDALPDSIEQQTKDSIQVRVLHNEQMRINGLKPVTKSRLSWMCASEEKQFDEISTIIVHMHGGGFIALSSRLMQTYTRRWARKLRIPIFSIDYRMPPEHPFPTATNDCLRVYEFLLTHIHKYMNVHPKKIILAGDSAGGNLTFSLCAAIMKKKLPSPYGLYAAYPALDLRPYFSPAKLCAFTDPLLRPSMLMLCLREYTKDDEEIQTNPIASPLLLTESYFDEENGNNMFPRNWPKTRIQVGAKDPLYDDSIRVMERMVNSKVDCKCQVYENLSHGFLNLDAMVDECEKTVTDSIEHLQHLINS